MALPHKEIIPLPFITLILTPYPFPFQTFTASKETRPNVYGRLSTEVVEFSNRQRRRSFSFPLAS